MGQLVRLTNAAKREVFVFFSSRRRHTRWSRDWSSDVCSSDLVPKQLRQIRAVLRIVECGDNPRRLVESKITRRDRRIDPLSVDFDTILGGVRLGPELRNDGAIDRNTPLDDPLFSLPPRGKT